MDKVLRASKAGYPCLRNLFYSVHTPEKGITSPHTQRIFDVGTYLEPLVVEWLRADGWEVTYNQGSQDAELELFVPLEGGNLAGHPDCFISKGEMQNVLVDIKTMNDRAFTLWKREGTAKSKPQYVDQLHVYAMGCIRAGIPIDPHTLGVVAVNKNNSDWHIDFFDFDFGRAADIQDKAVAVFTMTEPPEESSPAESWCCNYCEFSHFCERKGMFREKPIEELPASLMDADDDVVKALKDLAFAKEQAAFAKTMEADAKQSLLAYAKAHGKDTLKGGGYSCTITERTSTRFDSTAFKKAHPDLAAQYTSEATTTYFTLKEEL